MNSGFELLNSWNRTLSSFQEKSSHQCCVQLFPKKAGLIGPDIMSGALNETKYNLETDGS